MKTPAATATTSRSTCSDCVAGGLLNHSPTKLLFDRMARMLNVQVPISPKIAMMR
jgi:hypothetical protein